MGDGGKARRGAAWLMMPLMAHPPDVSGVAGRARWRVAAPDDSRRLLAVQLDRTNLAAAIEPAAR
jgi:hypothetical protein